jgi:hypothetical protein
VGNREPPVEHELAECHALVGEQLVQVPRGDALPGSDGGRAERAVGEMPFDVGPDRRQPRRPHATIAGWQRRRGPRVEAERDQFHEVGRHGIRDRAGRQRTPGHGGAEVPGQEFQRRRPGGHHPHRTRPESGGVQGNAASRRPHA